MVKVIMDVSALKDQKKGIVLQSTVPALAAVCTTACVSSCNCHSNGALAMVRMLEFVSEKCCKTEQMDCVYGRAHHTRLCCAMHVVQCL